MLARQLLWMEAKFIKERTGKQELSHQHGATVVPKWLTLAHVPPTHCLMAPPPLLFLSLLRNISKTMHHVFFKKTPTAWSEVTCTIYFCWRVKSSINYYSLRPTRFFTVSFLRCFIQFFTFQNLPKIVNGSHHFPTFPSFSHYFYTLFTLLLLHYLFFIH